MDAFEVPQSTRTSRFVLRMWQPGDGPRLLEAVRPSYDHLARFVEWVRIDQDERQSEVIVRRFSAQYLLGEDFTLGIFDPSETRVLGGTGFHLREGPFETRQAEIGMWIRVEEAGKGLGTAVLCEMLRWGFSRWEFLRLAWCCSTGNTASMRCAMRAGMLQEGVLRGQHDDVTGGRRDTACFAALAHEWVAPER